MKQKLFLCLLILISISTISAKSLEDDMKLFAQWFEGRFDNFAQYYNDKETKVEHPHERIHSIFKRVNLPNLGKDVFYVQQYIDGDESKIYRQRLYIFTPDKKEKALKLTIYNFDDDKKYTNSHLDPNKLNGLTMANLTTPPGCEVYWKINQARDKFDGYMKKDACKVMSKRLNKNIIITDDLVLTKDEIWINDQAKDEQGNYIFGNKSNIHHKLKKVRWFEGWTAILKNGETPTATADFTANDYDGQTKLVIHDQGGKVKLNEKYSVELANLQHRSGLWVMTFKVIENASGKAIAYTWTNPEAERIGINLRWMQSSFVLKK